MGLKGAREGVRGDKVGELGLGGVTGFPSHSLRGELPCTASPAAPQHADLRLPNTDPKVRPLPNLLSSICTPSFPAGLPPCGSESGKGW